MNAKQRRTAAKKRKHASKQRTAPRRTEQLPVKSVAPDPPRTVLARGTAQQPSLDRDLECSRLEEAFFQAGLAMSEQHAAERRELERREAAEPRRSWWRRLLSRPRPHTVAWD